ncbi:MAG: threonylcarbamoyl-AMP synthase [Actinobacteria bacterium]|nr:threonylcarbamoyl-AMP synthase [Actinomycetota bacterium]
MTPDEDRIERAAAAAIAGRLIVFPTDTVYGIGARPDDAAATGRLFEAKGRPPELELPVLIGSADEARRIAVFDDRAEALARRLWPGPLTIVVPRSEASRAWELGGDPSTIGVRMPRHPVPLAVLRTTGPLATTSANRSGEPPAKTCEELEATFGSVVDAFLCDPEPLEGEPSTVVDLGGPGWRLLREGAVSERAIREVFGRGDRPPV